MCPRGPPRRCARVGRGLPRSHARDRRSRRLPRTQSRRPQSSGAANPRRRRCRRISPIRHGARPTASALDLFSKPTVISPTNWSTSSSRANPANSPWTFMRVRACFPQPWPVTFITSFLLSRHRHPQPTSPTISPRVEKPFRPPRSSTWPVRKIRGESGRA